MKTFLILLLVTRVAIIEGAGMADVWREGAVKVGPIDLEPLLNGTGIFLDLTNVIGTFMDELEKAFENQIGVYTLSYISTAHNATVLIEEAVSNADGNTTRDAFDPLITEITDFVRRFIKDFKKPDTETRVRIIKEEPRGLSSKEKTPKPSSLQHSLNDFRYNAKSIVKADLAMLNSYIEEMLLYGRQNVLLNIPSIEERLETFIKFPIPYVKQELQKILTYFNKLLLHTSNSVLINFEVTISEALVMEF